MFEVFRKFTTDSIWGVRKVCLEMMPALLKILQAKETERLTFCMDFLKRSLTDESKWVRNQAYS